MLMRNNYLTYYRLLGVDPNSTEDQIKFAWKQKIKEHHSDLNGDSKSSTELSMWLNQAKEVLLDPSKRLEYDYLIGVKMKPQAANSNLGSTSSSNSDKIAGALVVGLIIGLFLDGGN